MSLRQKIKDRKAEAGAGLAVLVTMILGNATENPARYDLEMIEFLVEVGFAAAASTQWEGFLVGFVGMLGILAILSQFNQRIRGEPS